MILGIYGAGGSGREIYEMINRESQLRCRWTDIVFIADNLEKGEFYTCERLPFAEFSQKYSCSESEIIIAVGEPESRKMLAERVKEKGYRLATVISTEARVNASAEIGEGSIVTSGVRISSDAKVESNVWIGGLAIIGHDVNIKNHCQISSFAAIAGRTVVEECVFVGISACIREGLVIGHNSIIAMGAVVLKSVRDNKVVIGNPARECAENVTHKVFHG